MKRSASLLILLLIPLPGIAGDGTGEVQAVRTETPPVLDGFLNDSVWERAIPVGDFTQRDPEEGKPATERSEIRVLYDDEALYFGCMYYDSNPAGIVARLTRRDNEIDSDRGSIRIDSYHDHQTAYEFTFNAAGVKIDILMYDDGNREDPSWDPVWELETRILDNGWSAEAKIPFSVLRFEDDADGGEHEWGINFFRLISRKNERLIWAFWPKSESGFVSRFGHLTGVSGVPSPRRLELLPFVVGKHDSEPERSYQDQRSEISGDAGMDLKYSLTSNWILDATINPDFGQVEVDPEVLNLTTFETFFPEKRPFFIEGTQIIRFSTFGDAFGPGMFYSRRIGRATSVSEVSVPENGKVVSFPKNVSILGAAKVSGRTAEGLSVGVLQAFTREETATVADSNGVRAEQLIEPFAHYNVIRLRQDILENSNVGVIATSVAKEGLSPAVTGGADWNIRLAANTYQVNGFLALTRTTGNNLQRVNGSAGKLQFARIGAEHWLWDIGVDYTSPRYNINDIGFFFRPDDYGATGNLTYKEDRPSGFYRDYSISLFLHERRNFDNVNIFREANLRGDMLFANYWEFDAGYHVEFGKYDDRETRGNGDYQKPHAHTVNFSVETDSRENISVEASQSFGWDTKLKQQRGTGVGLNIRPLTWMEWHLSGGYERVSDFEAWVDNVAQQDGTTASIFADRSTEQVDITLRGAVTFTRELTLELYGQVFLAKGHFRNFRRLQGTSTFETFNYSEDPDFNEQAVNFNIVLRWEYLPGSTMFLVWSQARQDENGMYDSSTRDNFQAAFEAPAANVFLLKVSYWLNI
ncbi:MAG: carbohydrate binding family 9 domain-containing protein [Ignavibacteria bacterium]|nr:carbohydrate binding family 9 domain-containing protein [Ignavibacteria bacterium]